MSSRNAIALFFLNIVAGTAAKDRQRFEPGEEFVFQMEEAAGLPHREIKVIIDPKAQSCGWANTIAGENIIGLEPDCWQAHDADYQAAVLAHELGHIHRGHTQHGGGASKLQQLEADELGGYALGMMGASLRQALAHATVTLIGDSGPDPPRAFRIEATTNGWELSQRALQDESKPFWKPEAVEPSASVSAARNWFGIDVHSFLIGCVCTFAFVLFIGRGR